MKFHIVENDKPTEILAEIDLELKPSIHEGIIHDGIPYQITNIAYITEVNINVVMVRQLNKLKVGEGGVIKEERNYDSLLRDIFGI